MGDFFKNLVYSNEDVIIFPSGIPGFEECRKFVLASIAEYAPFEWLVGIDNPPVRFAIINPMLIRPDYQPAMIRKQFEDIEIEQPHDVLLYSIVTIRENPLESTANLVGPVIINKRKRIGKQVIIDDERYTTQEFILRNQ
jgi:flagellar assembly factor FliW